ncbi:hypothetical protein [Thiohalomonas denitrificans]|uniref:hypothetical protein n=1 Tax=Thiohalomonas denitrificans TaxID=415747 RepID=UPI0026ECBC36|nr:hypothetical protein [Thiohalomonas denitrificans]
MTPTPLIQRHTLKKKLLRSHLLGGPEDFRIDRFEAVHYVAVALAFAIIVITKLMFVL